MQSAVIHPKEVKYAESVPEWLGVLNKKTAALGNWDPFKIDLSSDIGLWRHRV
jgi:hypothetical protein